MPDDFENIKKRHIDFEEVYEKTVSEIFNIEDSVLRTIAIDKMINNKKVKEIAVEHNMNENTVKTKLRKIRLDIRTAVIKKNPQLEQKIQSII
jgi:hypothetical protein